MRKLIKYLRPYVITLPLCFVMLFGQAMCDLNLPNLMSNIVNVGIQQKGVSSSSPDVISEDGFRLMNIFMTSEQKNLVEQNYEFIQTGNFSKSYNKYVKRYPVLETKSIYVQKLKKDTKVEDVNKCFEESSAVMAMFLKSPAKDSSYMSYISPDNISEFDFSRVYQILPALEQFPESSFKESRISASSMDDYVKSQMSIMMTEKFYEEVGINISSMQNQYTLRIGIYMVVLTLLGSLLSVIVSFLSARISAGLSKSLRRDIFKKIESFSNNELDKFSTASLITRTTNDITQVQTTVMIGIRMICYAPIMGIGGIVMALNKSISMSWIIAVAVIVLVGIIMIIYALTIPKFKEMQQLIDKLNLIIREHLKGMLVIRAFGTQKFEEERFDLANKQVTNVSMFTNRIMVIMMPVMMLLMNLISVLIIFIGAHQISGSGLQVGDMMAFMQYAIQIIIAFLTISMMFILVPRASVSANRIAEVLNTVPTINDKKPVIKFNKKYTGKIEFKNVSFKYSGADDYALNNINFKALPGQITAIVGSTGSGKSTIVNLIPRFYDTTEGQILIDDIDIKDIPQQELRKNIGLVPQKSVLFSGSIKSNMQLDKLDVTDEDILEALKVAQATKIVESKENGLNSSISQGGDNVSGGQKQRFSIARALVKKAKVYIFDDSFSALDFKTDAAIRKALREYTQKSTVIIVAQRISTIMEAEQIIVVDEGKVVGIGTHKELINNCKEYIEIAESQFSKEELKQ